MNKENFKKKPNLLLNNNFEKLNFITFEGIDGSGKTTIIKKVFEKLSKMDSFKKELVLTREPGGTILAEKIRNIILDNKMHSTTEALLYAASRSEHVFDVIYPAIKANKLVLCDRYIDSSICYQGVYKKLNIVDIININKFATNDLSPDLIFYIDVSVEVSIDRIKANRTNIDRFDLIQIQDKLKIKQAYDNLFKSKNNVIKINGELDVDTICNEVVEIILFLLESENIDE